jgi:NADPH-dependent ferric siderophore reductase
MDEHNANGRAGNDNRAAGQSAGGPPREGALSAAALAARRGREWSLRVVGASDVTPHMRRVQLTGDALDEFAPRPAQELVLHLRQNEGEPARRHYTIRRFDRVTKLIDVDFVLHGHATPGVSWALKAKPGDQLLVNGPRGRIATAPEADWHLFTGDETALPAIFALAEALPASAKAFIFLEIGGADDKQKLAAAAKVALEWLPRGSTPPGPSSIVADAIAGFPLPPGKGHAIILGETSNVRAQRHALLARGMAREQIYAEGYWRPGRIGGHDHIRDDEDGPDKR